MSYFDINITRRLGDIENLFDPPAQIGQEIQPYFNTKNYSHSSIRSFLPRTRYNIISCRNSGDLPPLARHNYELERPIQFSNDIRVAYLQYKALMEKSRQLAMEELHEQSFSYSYQMKRLEAQQEERNEALANDHRDRRTIPEVQSIAKLADNVSQQVIEQAYPHVGTQIRYLTNNEPNMDIVKYLEAGFASRDLTDEGHIDKNSDLWKQFLDIYEDAKMVEGIQYVQDLTGEDLSTILDDYANDYYDLQMTTHHKQDSRQYHLSIPPQWASPEVIDAAKWICRQRLLKAGDIPELLPFNHNLDDMVDLDLLAVTQDDEMLTQTAIRAASVTSNHLDLVKDTTVIDTLEPYIQFEQNTLNMLQSANAIIFKAIYDRQSVLMEQIRAFKPSIQAEIDVLRQFDLDALERFNTMHLMHRELIQAYANGTASRVQMFQQLRSRIEQMYLEWIQNDHTIAEQKNQDFLLHKLAAEKKIDGELNTMKREQFNILSRDRNTSQARDAYLDSTNTERSGQLDGLYTTLTRIKQQLAKSIDDEFTKLDMFMTEVDMADKEFALYIDKVEVHKREWDRYSLLTKAAVIKSIVLQSDGDNDEADDLLDSSNKNVLNMEYLKKVSHVIGAEIEKVANVAGKRLHNAYCQFDPTLNQYQARSDRSDMHYPIPEPFILSPNIIIPENRQFFSVAPSSSNQQTQDYTNLTLDISNIGNPNALPNDFGFNSGNMDTQGPGRLNPQYNQQSFPSRQSTGPSFRSFDPLTPTLNPHLPNLPEDMDEFENIPYEDRTPTRNPDSGVGAFQGAFQQLIQSKSAYAAGLYEVVPGNDGNCMNPHQHSYFSNVFGSMWDKMIEFSVWGIFPASTPPPPPLPSSPLPPPQLDPFSEIATTIYTPQLDQYSHLISDSTPLDNPKTDSNHHQGDYPQHSQQQFPHLAIGTTLVRTIDGFTLLKAHPNGYFNSDCNGQRGTSPQRRGFSSSNAVKQLFLSILTSVGAFDV